MNKFSKTQILVLPMVYLGFCTCSCTISPSNNAKFNDLEQPIAFAGYAENPGSTVEILALNKYRGVYQQIGTAISSATPTYSGTTKLYRWDASVLIWNPAKFGSSCFFTADCRLPGVAPVHLKFKENGSRLGNLITFDEGGVSCVLQKMQNGADWINAGYECRSSQWPILTMGYVDEELVGYWNFDGNGNDMGYHGNNITMHGPEPTYDCCGFSNQAMFFDGVDDYALHYDTDGDFDLTEFTVALWIKTESLPVGDGDPPNPGYVLVNKGGGATNFSLDLLRRGGASYSELHLSHNLVSGGNTCFSSSTPIHNQQWYHVAASVGANKTVLYVNGKNVYEVDSRSTPAINDGPLWIGANGIEDFYFHGAMDDVRVYSRVLSNDEVRALAR